MPIRLYKYLAIFAQMVAMFSATNGVVIAQTITDELDGSFRSVEFANEFIRITDLANAGPNTGNGDQFYVTGSFNYIEGNSVTDVARLNSDGSVDRGFTPRIVSAIGRADKISAVSVQPDGKVLIGGNIRSVNGVTRTGIARLNTDGSLDTSFDPVFSFNGEPDDVTVRAIELQSNNQILVGGFFKEVDGVVRDGVARLNSDGSLDTTFNFTGSLRGTLALAIQQSGQILVGGFEGLQRLSAVAVPDASFPASVNGTVNSIAIQANGDFVLGGTFSMASSESIGGAARFNSNGAINTSFNPSPSNGVTQVRNLADGRLLFVGTFTTIASIASRGVAIINADGSADEDFSSGYIDLRDALPLLNGNILLAGSLFPSFLDSVTLLVVSDENVSDPAFDAGSFEVIGGTIRKITPIEDDYLIVGDFTRVNGQSADSIVRVDRRGRVDSSFKPLLDNDLFFDAAVDENGKILVVGNFNTINGESASNLARLNTDGSVDNSFNANGAPLFPLVVRILANQQIIVAGNTVTRHQANGALDETFTFTTNNSGFIQAVIEQANGKLLVGGNFTQLNDTNRAALARLELDGSLDLSLAPQITRDTGNADVTAIEIQPDGKILFGGIFDEVDTLDRVNIARLNSNTMVDPDFDVAVERNVLDLELLDDGGILVAGINQVNNEAVLGMALLDSAGNLDTNFTVAVNNIDPGSSAGVVNVIELDSEGGILAGGLFRFVNGVPRMNLARFGESLPDENFCFVIKSATNTVFPICL